MHAIRFRNDRPRFASIPPAFGHGGDASLVHGCVNPSGLTRIVGPNGVCGDNEYAIDWGIQGPPGPPGQDGVDGQDGMDGQDGKDGQDGQDGMDGLDGITGYLRIRQTADWADDNPPYFRTMVIQCPEGRVVLGGGHEMPHNVEVEESFPSSDSSWTVKVFVLADSAVHGIGYAICGWAL